MFATCDIAMGDLIFAERPVLVMPRKMMILNVDPGAVSVDEIPDAQTIQMHIAQREKFLEVLVERMEERDQEEFYELFNSHTEDGSGPILGRVRTNGFAVIFGDEKTAEPHSATFLKGSRMNHRFFSFRFSLQTFALINLPTAVSQTSPTTLTTPPSHSVSTPSDPSKPTPNSSVPTPPSPFPNLNVLSNFSLTASPAPVQHVSTPTGIIVSPRSKK
ncbi:hypothetical protein H0H93_016323, partial [Arthromyces matolae]